MINRELKEQAIWNPKTGITSLKNVDKLRATQIPGIKAVWGDTRKRLQANGQLSAFNVRLNREWAIETGIVENLYQIDRGITQTLIEQGFRSELLPSGSNGNSRDRIIRMLQDQQDALDGIFDFVKDKQKLTLSYIKQMHSALLRNQDTTEGIDQFGRMRTIPLLKGTWKEQPNSPVRDGVLYTYAPPEQVASEMEKLLRLYKKYEEKGVPSEVQAAWLHHRFVQIHPFQDGNGRIARTLASLILIKNGLFPLVITRDSKVSYIKALEDANKGDLKPLVKLIVDLQIVQLNRATKIYKKVSENQDVGGLLSGLQESAGQVASNKRTRKGKVLEHAEILEENLQKRLEEIAAGSEDSVETALKKVSDDAWAKVERSKPDDEHYFRKHIFENANRIDYFANMKMYRSWVMLEMNWQRRGRLIFAFHGTGHVFNGSLICAPFLEFVDRDDESRPDSTFIPLADEGFAFFYNEKKEELLSRFEHWREEVIKAALKELIEQID